jgi:retron-type reverse transcriptase
LKPYTHLYPQVCAWENLERAYRQARKGKRGRAPAANFERRLEDNLVALQDELLTQTYRPGAYQSFYIHEPKRRLISAAPFRDRVVHHALCNIIEPLFERRFIFDSYANRVGKGTHRALDRCQQFARRYPYALQLDVVQFFPSVDHAILQAELARVIGDEQVRWLCNQILASGQGVQAGEYHMVYFPGDDLFALNRPRGLPIGNLTSQFWANVHMSPLDHFVKRELKCPAYLRFVDDLILFAEDKHTLWQWRTAVLDFLAHLRLMVHLQSAHPHCRRPQVSGAEGHPRPVAEGLPFLGFTVYPDHRRLKAQKAISFRRKFKRLVQALAQKQLALEDLHAAVRGWVNHARYGDTWGLRRAVLGAFVLT